MIGIDYQLQDQDDVLNELSSIKDIVDSNKLNMTNAYLICYAVIRASGSIESTFKDIIYKKVSEGTSYEVKNYLTSQIVDSSTNPKTGAIENCLEKFNSNWKIFFCDEIKKMPQIKDELNSLVQLRNDFAHGSSINISIETVIRYYESGLTVLNILKQSINK